MSDVRRLRVENATRSTVVGDRIRLASSMRDRTVGLLRTPGLEHGQGLWIEGAPSIHMFFMRYPIDAVFVDGGRIVVKVVQHLRPWRVVWWARGARDCIELPVGTIARTQTQVGDRLEVIATDPQTSRATPSP